LFSSNHSSRIGIYFPEGLSLYGAAMAACVSAEVAGISPRQALVAGVNDWVEGTDGVWEPSSISSSGVCVCVRVCVCACVCVCVCVSVL
jgi:hypothetical protein